MHHAPPDHEVFFDNSGLVCRYCGETHRPVPLVPGRKFVCQRCGIIMARGSRVGPDGLAAAILVGLVFAAPAFCLPFVRVANLGSLRPVYLWSSAEAFWTEHLPVVAVWTLTCIMAVPLLMLLTLAGITLPAHRASGWAGTAALKKVAAALAEWAMPEVFVLSVLVSLTKLGSVVEVRLGPGFWSYIVMSLGLLFAWRTYSLGFTANADKPAQRWDPEIAE